MLGTHIKGFGRIHHSGTRVSEHRAKPADADAGLAPEVITVDSHTSGQLVRTLLPTRDFSPDSSHYDPRRVSEAIERQEITGGAGLRPKVSVAIVTYNHRPFIEETVASALRQETPFDLEIVIGDDCSTDGTREILEAYGRRDDRIRLLLHPERLGPPEPYLGGKNNFLATYRACRGQYVAFLDGDDCWTDTAKLRKQVEFLDAHPDYAFCCHPVTVEYRDNRTQHWTTTLGVSAKARYTLEDILRLETKPEMPMVSMMIRSDFLTGFPGWFQGVANGDYALQVLLARQGDVAFLPDCMAIHRKHAGGRSRIYDANPALANGMLLKLHIALNEELDFRFRHILAPYIEHESELAAVADLFATLQETPPSQEVSIPLDEFEACNGSSLTLDRGITVVTPPTRWAYAAALELPSTNTTPLGRRAAFVRVRVRVGDANAAVGVVDAAGAVFIDRACVEPSSRPSEVLLRIPDLADAGQLIVHSWEASESATVYIDRVDLMIYSIDLPPSGDATRRGG